MSGVHATAFEAFRQRLMSSLMEAIPVRFRDRVYDIEFYNTDDSPNKMFYIVNFKYKSQKLSFGISAKDWASPKLMAKLTGKMDKILNNIDEMDKAGTLSRDRPEKKEYLV